MIECPKCWSKFSGQKCKCGWYPSPMTPVNQVEAQERENEEKAFSQYARDWNDRNAGTKGLSGTARKAALLAYCKKLNAQPKVCDSEPRLWAAKLISRIAEGEVIPSLAERMAKQAMGVKDADV